MCWSLFGATVVLAQSDSSITRSQSRPKVGVVLSGGGAKGLAHIAFLRVLEEAGIYPDYITGTSMGSIIGAMYSMGYTTDQMTTMATTINWDEVISNNVPLNRVAFEEKPYYGRYLVDLSFRDGKLYLPSALVEGQRLHLLLASLTHSVQGQEDFREFPIPFACVATDISEGTAVLLDSGDIVKSIRASMAIPTIFTPVLLDDRLLVDGGVVRNFPVQEVRDMGADVVIGSYVGRQFHDKDELQSLSDILLQVTFLPSMYDYEEQRQLADLVVLPEDNIYSAADFIHADSIIAIGYRNAKKWEDELIQLGDSLGLREERAPRETLSFVRQDVRIDSIVVEGNDRLSEEFILGKLGIKPGETYSTERIEQRINVAYGTQYFQRITYNLKYKQDGSTILFLEVAEEPRVTVKFALHYDTETNVGLTVNITARNLFSVGGRLITEIDFSDNPRVNMNFFRYLGTRQNLALTFGGTGVTQRDLVSDFFGPETVYRGTDIRAFLGAVTTGSPNYAFGVQTFVEYVFFSSTLRSDTIFNDYRDQSWGVEAYFNMNTMNRPFFPTQGIQIQAAYRYKLAYENNFNLRSQPALLSNEVQTLFDFGDVDPYGTLQASASSAIPVNKRFSILAGGDLAFHTTNQILLSDFYNLGGLAPILPNAVAFWGEDPFTYQARNYLILRGGAQVELMRKLVAEVHVNYLNPNEPFSSLTTDYSWVRLTRKGKRVADVWGGGARLNYLTFLGPISVGVHQSNHSPTLYTYLSIGFKY